MMNKLRLFFKSYKFNIILNILLTLQLCFSFLIINANISDVVYTSKANNYVSFVPDNVVYFSGSIRNNVPMGDVDSFFHYTETLRTSEGVLDVGYQLEDGVILEKDTSITIPCLYLNDTMQMVEYNLKEGRWFSTSNNANEHCEIIIGGNISGDYEVGEVISMYSARLVNQKVTYKTIQAEIVGKLDIPAMAIDLGYLSNKPQYINLFKKYGNVVLTNSDEVIKYDTIVKYPLSSIVVHLDETCDISQLSHQGQLISFHSIADNSLHALKDNITNKLPSILSIFLIVFLSITGTTFINIFKSMKYISIFYLNGMSKNWCAVLVIFHNMISLFVGLILSILLSKSETIRTLLLIKDVWGIYNIMVSLLIILMTIAISVICAMRFSKQPIYAILRRTE